MRREGHRPRLAGRGRGVDQRARDDHPDDAPAWRKALDAGGAPPVPRWTTRRDGQRVATVFPADADRSARLHRACVSRCGSSRASPRRRARSTATDAPGRATTGRCACVLGAGNVSSIGPLDVLDKLFVRNEVVVLKMNPVNDYLAPIFRRAFAPLIEMGVLDIVTGGAEVGRYLCAPSAGAEHPPDRIRPHARRDRVGRHAIRASSATEGRGHAADRQARDVGARVGHARARRARAVVADGAEVPGPQRGQHGGAQRQLQLQRRQGARAGARVAAARGVPRRAAGRPGVAAAAEGVLSGRHRSATRRSSTATPRRA